MWTPSTPRATLMPMHITCHAHREFPASAEQAFALSIDSVRFPHWFRGYGPIAAIERIESNGAPRVGGQRTVYNADGRSEERRVGNECVSTVRYRWGPYT